MHHFFGKKLIKNHKILGHTKPALSQQNFKWMVSSSWWTSFHNMRWPFNGFELVTEIRKRNQWLRRCGMRGGQVPFRYHLPFRNIWTLSVELPMLSRCSCYSSFQHMTYICVMYFQEKNRFKKHKKKNYSRLKLQFTLYFCNTDSTDSLFINFIKQQIMRRQYHWTESRSHSKSCPSGPLITAASSGLVRLRPKLRLTKCNPGCYHEARFSIQ